jgi:hypothetical protein
MDKNKIMKLINKILKPFIFRKEYGSNGYKNSWMTFYPGMHKWRFQISPASYFDNRAEISFSFLYGSFYIHIPFIRSKYDECDPPSYGFYFYGDGGWFPDSICFKYGRKYKFFNLPWSYEWVRTSVYLKTGKWEHETKGNRKEFYDNKWDDKILYETYPYAYILGDKGSQYTKATVSMYEREWRPKWFKWTKLFSRVSKTIDVKFQDEIGGSVGSYKGGVLGCGYEMKEGETMKGTLIRMMLERKFR